MNPWMGLPVVLCSIFLGVSAVQAVRYELAARRRKSRKVSDEDSR